MSLLASLAVIFGSLGSIANIPQAYKIFKRKKSGDISLLTYSLLLPGTTVWILYGIEISNFPIIFVNSLSTVCILTVIYGWFLYNKN